MSYPEVRPQDVSPADAQQILDFLNQAQTAAELAERIELPNEPDIGPRLGARLLERRAELGSFTSLDQLLTVPLIGSVRLTRIVRSLLGRLPAAGVDREAFEALLDEVRALRARVEALEGAVAPPRVALRAVGPQRYLGQPLALVATVTGPDGLRRADVPVTLSATWGRLCGSDGFSVQEGTSVTLRAAGDGTVRATLVPPTSEDLQATQQAAVETMLGRLDPAAPTPADAADALASLVQAYRFQANDDFRDGVDVYFRDFHQHLVDRVNYRDELQRWATFDAAVVAYVHGRDDGGGLDTCVQAAAALVVRLRDWLGPWLQTHVEAAGSETLLGGELRLAGHLDDPDDVLSRIHERVGQFVTSQQGVVGQLVGQKVAEAKLGSFLESGIDALPSAARQALFPALDSSSATIGALGVHALGALEQTRAELRRSLDTRIAAGIEPALERSSTLAGLQDALAAKVDQTAFDSALATKLDAATLNAKLSAASDFSTFKTSLTSVLAVMVSPEHLALP